MLKSLIVLVAVVFCTVLAQLPRPCNSPSQWEGRFSRYDVSRNFTQYAGIAYDAVGRRVREREELAIGSTTDFYDVLRLFNERKEYRVNLRTRTCNVTAFTRPFIDIGLPSDANFTDSFVIGLSGLPNEHVTAAIFEGSYEGGRYFGIVSTPDCIPLRFGYDSPTYGFEDTRYYDIKAGISDPGAFIPPSICSGRYFGIVSTPDCIPLRFGYDSPTYGFENTRYYDIKAGISDPGAFIPPSICSGR